MPEIKPGRRAAYNLLGFTAIIVVIALALYLPNSTLFQGELELNPAAGSSANCTTLSFRSIPPALAAYQSGTLVLSTTPPEWNGKFRIQATSGILTDSSGNEGSVIETFEKVINFSGGEAMSRLTAQAIGDNQTQCLATIDIGRAEQSACKSLNVSVTPTPLPPDQSAEFSFSVSPAEWNGSLLVQAESGSFQLTQPDTSSLGENTSTIITGNRKILYSGGKAGEKIRVMALGQDNSGCEAALTVARP